MTEITIERHTGGTLPPIADLSAVAAAEGHHFVERARAEWSAGLNRFDRPGECLLIARAGAAEGDGVVGMCGVNIDPYLDDPLVGRLRHLYVVPPFRRDGIGVALVEACRAAAIGHFIRLRLRTANSSAAALYEAIGFDEVAEATATHSWTAPPRSTPSV